MSHSPRGAVALLVLAGFALTSCGPTDPASAPVPGPELQQGGPFLPPGVVAWWPGDGNASDIVGGNHGTVFGATFAAGQVGSAFTFDGVDDYVEVAAAPQLQFGTGEFTLDFWARIVDPSSRVHILITSQDVATDPPGILAQSRGNSPPIETVLFDVRDGVNTQTVTVPTPMDGQFHYYAFTRSGTDLRAYLDGVDLTTTVNATGIASMNSGTSLLFGRTGFSSPLPFHLLGQLDEITLHNRALAPSEISAIFAAGTSGTVPKRLVSVCHKPGTPAAGTLVVPFAALPAHLGHGDFVGTCP